MANLICPSCKSEMTTQEDPDITIEKCPDCGGVFLDKGELNALATGLSGNIEYCSIDKEHHPDDIATRSCPKCAHAQMHKVNLLRFSDIIFDFCRECEGFFLDKEESRRMNEELDKLAPDRKSEEFRDYLNERLVRIDRVDDVGLFEAPAGIATAAVKSSYIKVTVFHREALPVAFRVHKEKWTARLAKAVHLFQGHDIPTGDKEFDSTFCIEGEDEEAILHALTPSFRDAALAFVRARPSIISHHGSLEISARRITYVEGPYATGAVHDLVEQADAVVRGMVALSEAIVP
jgi:Zn-finger nucleic acid-binding protein